MMIATRRLCTFGALLLSLTLPLAASAQGATVAPSPFEVFLGHFDLGVSGSGEFTASTSGLNYLKQQVALTPSNTLGALVELRYTVSPRIGIQYTYSYARYTDNFNITETSQSSTGSSPLVLGVQTKATEESLGYIGHFGDIVGLKPFIGLGGGVMAFRPTAGGGDGLPGLSRGEAYYAVGVEQDFNEHLGLRVQFRQTFFGAPDFNTNYFANNARSSAIQPTAGIYLRF